MTIYLPPISVTSINPLAVIEEKATILDEVDELIKQCDTKPLAREDIAASARQLIERFNQLIKENLEKNLPIAREGLCRLLKLNIEEVEVLKSLKSVFFIKYLSDDVMTNQSAQFLILERLVSNLIAKKLSCYTSDEFLLSITCLYINILERLWLLPHLVEDRSSYALIIEQNWDSIVNFSSQWISSLEKKLSFEDSITVIRHLFRKLDFKDPEIITALEGLKAQLKLKSPDILSCLGNIYSIHKNTRRSLDHYEAHLKFLVDFKKKDIRKKSDILYQIGNAYHDLRDYGNAIKFYTQYLKNSQELNSRFEEGIAHHHLGVLYRAVSEHNKAVEHHQKHLQIAQEVKNEEWEGKAYSNIGISYYDLKKYHDAIIYYQKRLEILEIAQQEPDILGKGKVYGNLGNSYKKLKDYTKAMEYHQKHLKIAQDLKKLSDEGGIYHNIEGGIYCNIGNIHESRKDYQQAIEYYKKHLEITRKVNDLTGQGRAYYNLGLAYSKSNDLVLGEKFFNKSLHVYSEIQNSLGNEAEWKIKTFERQAKAYLKLESLLLKKDDIDKALKITNERRARALLSSISQKNSEKPIPILDAENMKNFARRLQTTFIIYSLSNFKSNNNQIEIWVVKENGIIFQKTSASDLPDYMKDPIEMLKKFPFIRDGGRPPLPSSLRRASTPNSKTTLTNDRQKPVEFSSLPNADQPKKTILENPGESAVLTQFKERLSKWYTVLIEPIESYFPIDPNQSLTFITEGFLSRIPFAILKDRQDKFLIEKHPILMTPSLNVLHLLEQVQSQRMTPPSFESLVIGNPTTNDPKDNLAQAEEEAKDVVAPLLQTSPENILIKEAATLVHFQKKAPSSQFIHMACHGLTGEKPEDKLDPNSVFEGLFKLASDQENNGRLYAQTIAKLSLAADLVFMSACFSGRGKLQKEGNIGPVWSFLGAGALSTVATYWRVPDTQLTLNIVKTFYQHILGKEKLNKAQALQKALLLGVEKDRQNPHQWGAFFLSGLVTTIADKNSDG